MLHMRALSSRSVSKPIPLSPLYVGKKLARESENHPLASPLRLILYVNVSFEVYRTDDRVLSSLLVDDAAAPCKP